MKISSVSKKDKESNGKGFAEMMKYEDQFEFQIFDHCNFNYDKVWKDFTTLEFMAKKVLFSSMTISR